MLMTSDEYKLAASRIGELEYKARTLTSDRAKRLSAIRLDPDRSESWKASQAGELEAGFNTSMKAILQEAKKELASARLLESQYRNPTMLFFGHRAKGASTPEADHAEKSEFRAFIQSLPLDGRKAWFDALAHGKDWGRLGVLIALEPSLASDALLLDIPGRDEGLKQASALRQQAEKILTTEAERIGMERIIELDAKPLLTERESHERMVLAVKQERGWRDFDPEEGGAATRGEASRLSLEEEQRYNALQAKAETPEGLTGGEGVELVALASRLN